MWLLQKILCNLMGEIFLVFDCSATWRLLEEKLDFLNDSGSEAEGDYF